VWVGWTAMACGYRCIVGRVDGDGTALSRGWERKWLRCEGEVVNSSMKDVVRMRAVQGRALGAKGARGWSSLH
jgi:hypothetical protein